MTAPAEAPTTYETVIGLEVHIQSATRSKMFCGCSTDYAGAPPNTHVCPVCLGMPGTLPVINEQAIENIVLTGLALNCDIAVEAKFDRKNYHYPDLMKGYQISQFDLPVCVNGWMDLMAEGTPRRVGITRVHMEEDTARSLHRGDPFTGEGHSLIDINRSGTPLMECVTEPDMRSAAEAREFLQRLRQILRYIGVSEANMDEGQMRCDANISLRPVGTEAFGTKVEIKNMNSFRSVHDAIVYEVERQARVLSEGGTLPQETRGWDDVRGETVSQRSKEYSQDYRYFPEPDLPPLRFNPATVEALRAQLPELPAARQERFLTLGLSEFEAVTLTENRERADYFEQVLAAIGGDATRAAKLAANWVLGDVGRWVNAHEGTIADFPVEPAQLAELIRLAEAGTITGSAAKTVLDTMIASGEAPTAIVEAQGLAQVSGEDELTTVVREVIAANPQAVADYQAGKASAVKFLMGQVMRQTRGRANPQVVESVMVRELH